MIRTACTAVLWVAGVGVLGSLAACGSVASESMKLRKKRHAMVRDQVAARGVKDKRVLRAMRTVRRHLFVPASQRRRAYEDRPLPIGYRQTISQPYIVAYMTEALRLKPGDKVLEVGTGSGYQAAVLAKIAQAVYSIEILEPLGLRSKKLLGKLGYRNVQVRIGDGYRGWPQAGPFDAIIVTAAPSRVPPALIGQLKVGGRLVMPVGTARQNLIRITRTQTGVRRENLLDVIFVPMTGEVQRRGAARPRPRPQPRPQPRRRPRPTQ
jgi:protein-L-isoaspartate(D-aspartate) O-methyltransferase